MGCAGMRFGRNVPRKFTKCPAHSELMTPNPRIISEKLLARPEGTFQPATIVNLLAAAWIQFQVHDWAQHSSDRGKQNWNIPLLKGDSWSDRTMEVRKTQPDTVLSEEDKQSPAYQNDNTHWWDGSQIYGSSEKETQALRSECQHGELKVDFREGATFLPRDSTSLPETGFRQNWWLGLELLHTLFALEHNAIASRLRVSNPTWTSD